MEWMTVSGFACGLGNPNFVWGIGGLVIGFILGVLCMMCGRKCCGFGAAPDGEGVELYVGNLNYDLKSRDLNDAFEKYGKVDSVRIIKNRMNGKSKGYGFVHMANRTEARAAIKALNGSDLRGRKIVVNEARSNSREDD